MGKQRNISPFEAISPPCNYIFYHIHMPLTQVSHRAKSHIRKIGKYIPSRVGDPTKLSGKDCGYKILPQGSENWKQQPNISGFTS